MGPGVATRVPDSIQPLTRIVYLADSDTMVLRAGRRREQRLDVDRHAHRGVSRLSAGNTTKPDLVITLPHSGAKSIDAVGNHLFVGYWFSSSGPLWPNVDAFNLTTGKLDTTLVNASPATVDTSSAIDAMYSIRAYRRSNGEYVVMKNNERNSITVYRWTP